MVDAGLVLAFLGVLFGGGALGYAARGDRRETRREQREALQKEYERGVQEERTRATLAQQHADIELVKRTVAEMEKKLEGRPDMVKAQTDPDVRKAEVEDLLKALPGSESPETSTSPKKSTRKGGKR